MPLYGREPVTSHQPLRNSIGRRVDPYQQSIDFNGRHVTAEDDEEIHLPRGTVPQEDTAELAKRIKVRYLEKLAARIGLPAAILLLALVEALPGLLDAL